MLHIYQPLADRIRPRQLDDVVGQKHILGENGVLRRIIEGGRIPSLIFYGPSGTGKTTVAELVAMRMKRPLYRLNATTASLADLKGIMGDVGTLIAPEGVVLYLDEIQYFNKKQQQALLEYMENGSMSLIASTTENPYFYIYNAVLSRATIFEFKPLTAAEILPAIQRGLHILEQERGWQLHCETGVEEQLATACGGDVRKALNAVEALFSVHYLESGKVTFTLQEAKAVAQQSSLRYDRDGDSHFDSLSAFQKSIRGSDPDAGLYYLAKLLEGGDLISVCRRLLVIASEDVGLAYPQAISIVKACVDSAHMLGLPEARIPLAEAVILLSTAPKSNSAICGIDAAIQDIRDKAFGEIPSYLRDAHYEGAAQLGRGMTYRFPHDFPNHYVKQQYLPDTVKDEVYYQYGENKLEQAAKRYWDLLKG